jgi:hypothetical protein
MTSTGKAAGLPVKLGTMTITGVADRGLLHLLRSVVALMRTPKAPKLMTVR